MTQPSQPPKRFTGTWTIHHPSGRIAEEIGYRNGDWDGKRTTYYDDSEGTLKSVEHWKKSRRVGEWTTWHNNDSHQVRSIANWKDGLPDGPSVSFFPDGNKKSERLFRRGINVSDHKRWDENQNLEYVEHFRRGDLTTGEHLRDGVLWKIDVYEENAHVLVQYLENGEVVREEDPRKAPLIECELKVVGVYSVVPTVESIAEAVKFHRLDHLLDEKGRYKDRIHWENHRNLCLVEMVIRGDFNPDDLMLAISRKGQAPYMEFYLDPGGVRVLSEPEAVATLDRRACFFLHFVEDQTPITAGDASVDLKPVGSLPDRLVEFAHYIPVD